MFVSDYICCATTPKIPSQWQLCEVMESIAPFLCNDYTQSEKIQKFFEISHLKMIEYCCGTKPNVERMTYAHHAL